MSDFVTISTAKADKAFQKIAELANTIWTEHYTPIIGHEQVAYMISNFQSFQAIKSQVNDGAEYYLIFYKNEEVGYLCIQQEQKELFLSKIYILSTFRGLKIGKAAMDFIYNRGKELQCEKIGLTVNKFNEKSISAYEKLGFINMGPTVKDIGGGFIMDDYKMEKKLI